MLWRTCSREVDDPRSWTLAAGTARDVREAAVGVPMSEWSLLGGQRTQVGATCGASFEPVSISDYPNASMVDQVLQVRQVVQSRVMHEMN